MATIEELLATYKPLLIILPQDTSLHRPWNHWFDRYAGRRGDYHPLSAELFLAYVFQRGKPESLQESVFGNPTTPGPTGLEALRALVLAVNRDTTLDWEIDVAPIDSQNADEAWHAYAGIVDAVKPFQATAYGHVIKKPTGTGLEYWFLSAYNDAPNRHEGDWEMVAIELDEREQPVQAGYASHRSGLRRPWQTVEKDGSRPLVYVARGSHASYFDHKKEGHRTNSVVVPHKGLPAPIETLLQTGARLAQEAIVFLRLEDQTPTHPERPGDELVNQGTFADPQLVVLPEWESGDEQSPLWWMRLRCPWGSRHARFFGDTAPDPPWEQGDKWSDPVAWIRTLDLDT